MDFKWSPDLPTQEEGVIVGADLTQEWLLPWWWNHYLQFNSHPVAFVDFGMSNAMKQWCKERGKLIPLPITNLFVTERNDMEPTLVQQMEEACGTHFWPSRSAWFKKPLACLRSPFVSSIWIDLDCEIRGPLPVLFSFCSLSIALAKEPFSQDYNAGVIVFKKGMQIIEKWAEQSYLFNHLFRGDQDVLNVLIRHHDVTVTEFPSIYNWSRLQGPSSEAIVLHWHGPQGKVEIAHQIARTNLKNLHFGFPS